VPGGGSLRAGRRLRQFGAEPAAGRTPGLRNMDGAGPPINMLSPAGTEGQLFDVSCSSSTACTAVGDTDGGQGALIETSSGGSWVASSPSMAGLTPTAAHGAAGALTNVSCTSSGSCSEAGTYEDQTFATQGLVVAGTSATAVNLSTLKPAAGSNPLFSFEGLACFATCIAMGSYTFPQGRFSGRQTTVTTFSGRGASTTTASLSGLSPAPSSPAGPGYNQASCADATDCVAVGQYGAANGTIRSILETVAGGSSSAAAPSLAGVTTPRPAATRTTPWPASPAPRAARALPSAPTSTPRRRPTRWWSCPPPRRCRCRSPPARSPRMARRRQPRPRR
jgi:hypothetical protein